MGIPGDPSPVPTTGLALGKATSDRYGHRSSLISMHPCEGCRQYRAIARDATKPGRNVPPENRQIWLNNGLKMTNLG